MQALILAAGLGTRIGAHTSRTPKCLLEVGGRTLLQHQISALKAADFDSITIVVGFEQEQIRQVVNGSATYIVNDKYAETNSLYSFSLARNLVDDELLVVNSDVLFHPTVLDRLLSADGSALVYDSGSGDEAEHMKVAMRNGRLVEMSKELPAIRTRGENVGMLRFSREAAREAFAIADRLTAAGRYRDWLASAVNDTAQRHRFACIDIAGLPWIEIDFMEDLERARLETWPTIAASLAVEAERSTPALGPIWGRFVRAVRRGLRAPDPAVNAA